MATQVADVDTLIAALGEIGELLATALRVAQERLKIAGIVLEQLKQAREDEKK